MSLDVLLTVAGGILAILGGGAIVFLSPGRYPSLIAAASLSSLGFLQFGWARAIDGVVREGNGTWFALSLAFALPVSLCWVLFSRTLGKGAEPGKPGRWHVYIAVQALFAIVALGLVGLYPEGSPVTHVEGNRTFPLEPIGSAMLTALLLNMVLLTASFESTFLALPRADRQKFRPGLLGILVASGCFSYVSITSLLSGRVSLADISHGWVPVMILTVALPFSLIHGRVAEARVRREVRPLAKTTSLAITIGFIAATTVLLGLTRATGWSIARGIWLLLALGAALSIAGLAVSNRVRRRAQRLVDPYVYRRVVDRRDISARIADRIHSARSVVALCELIPRTTRELVGTSPVTLFFADDREARFTVVASTLEPVPTVSVLASDPLAVELGRTGRAIHLRGRADDLEYIPIYVENAAQLYACSAACGAPITHDEELLGFLLCGDHSNLFGAGRQILPVLDVVCALYSDHLETLLGSQGPAGTPLLGSIESTK